MSMASSPDCLFQSDDKTFQMLFPSVEGGNNLDEFINEELYSFEQQDNNNNESAEDIFGGEAFVSDYPRLPSLAGSVVQERSPPQPWRKGLWCLSQAQPTGLAVGKTRKPAGTTIPTAHLVNNDNFAIRNPRSPVVSPPLKSTKRFATSPNAAKYRNKAHVPISISREATLSPSPMYGQLPYYAKMEQVQEWQDTEWHEQFQNFHIRQQQHASTVSPISRNRVHNGQDARNINAAMVAQNAGIGVAISTYEDWQNVREDGSSGHYMLDPSLHLGGNLNGNTSPTGHGNSVMHQNLQEYHPTLTWTEESLHSSDSSYNSYETMQHSVHSGQSAHSAHDLLAAQQQTWWSPPADPRKANWPHGRRAGHPTLVAPAPQRAPAPAVIQNLDQPNGLGIRYSELEQMDSAVYQDVPYYKNFPTTPMPYSPLTGSHAHSIPPVPAIPAAFSPTHGFSNPEPFTTPRTLRLSPSRSRSVSLSPTNTTARVLRQRSPTRTDNTHSHHRRKSLHKTGPIRDSVGDSTPGGHTRTRSRSTSKPPRTPTKARTPTTGFAVDFINMTAKDAPKLLSDVAPSGSSKTRARREAEQRAHRKKFAETASNEVSRLGGDPNVLKKALFT